MKIIVIGSTGTIGSEVVKALSGKHEVVGLHRKSTPPIDLKQPETIALALAEVGKVDAVVCCAGGGVFKPLEQLSSADLATSAHDKQLGQAAVVLAAIPHVADNGSITVTSGSMARHPMPGGAAISMINAAVEGFVIGAALEAPRGIRVNAVSPPWIKETLEAMKMDASKGQPAADCARVYVGVVEGSQKGQVVDTTKA